MTTRLLPTRRPLLARALSLPCRRLGLAALILAVPTLAEAQNADDGKAVFNKCRACHQIGPGAKNLVGPELNGLIGRKAGSVEGFNYSEANKNSGITWDQATFREYIKNPRAKIPNTKMVFPGIQDEKDINDLLAFLEQYSADGKTK
jgi:cytochrome c